MITKAKLTTIMLILIASIVAPNLIAQAANQVQDISINYDEKTEVETNQVVHLPGPEEITDKKSGQNGYGYVTMPEDLPEGSKLTVSSLDDVKFVTDSNGEQITRCGEVYSFIVDIPDGTSYSETFSIALPYCNGLSDLDIYTLDESTDKWIRQDGDHDGHYQNYTAQIAHLDKVGIFSTEPIEEDSGNKVDDTTVGDETTIPLDEETSVNAKQKVLIENTGSWITMPSELPEGTRIKVEDATDDEFVTDGDGLEVSGDVLTVTLTLEDPGFEGMFTLVLTSNDSEGDIYYYNENEETWEKQDSVLNDAKTNLTMETNHFSTYGVFTEVTDDKKESTKNKSDKDDYVCYDDPAEMYITINFDEEVNVCPDQQITIADTLNYLVMPKDLPKNTTLTVTDVGESDIVTNAKGLHRAGDVLHFTLKTPEGSDFTDNITLKMPYANGVSFDDIYYYDEDTKEWESQGAEVDYEDFTLNVELSHLSTYGVFGIDDKGKVIEDDDDDDDLDTTEVTVESGDDDEGNGGILPSTATSLFNWILIGVILVAAGFTLFIINRRKSSKQE